MNYLDRRKARPITDALRATVLEDLPELVGVKDEELRRKAIEAWAYSLSETSFPRVSAIPGEATPGVFVLKRGNQAHHLRSVARIAVNIADDFTTAFPEAVVNRDVVLAGALLHDVGKAWEFEPDNLKRWAAEVHKASLKAEETYVYFKHEETGTGPEFARQLIAQLERHG